MQPVFETVENSKEMILKRLETEPFKTNTYLITCKESGETLVVDAPGSADAIIEQLNGVKVVGIVITHNHMDHLIALEELKAELNAPVIAHKDDAGALPCKADRVLTGAETLSCGKVAVRVMHTPGHTAGSIVLAVDRFLIAGDTLFPGGPGKTGSKEDFKTIIRSIKEVILPLGDETVILSGHGDKTTLGSEREAVTDFLDNRCCEGLYGDVTWQE